MFNLDETPEKVEILHNKIWEMCVEQDFTFGEFEQLLGKLQEKLEERQAKFRKALIY